MNYKGHLLGGIFTSSIVGGVILYLTNNNLLYSIICIVTTIIFALYPDLDIASKPSRYAFILGLSIITYLITTRSIVSAYMVLLLLVLPKMYPHRGFIHTIRFSVIAAIFYYAALSPYIDIDKYFIYGSVIAGYFTHLLLDKHIKL